MTGTLEESSRDNSTPSGTAGPPLHPDRSRGARGKTASNEAIGEAGGDPWIDVCRADRIPQGRGVCALVGDRQIALFRVGTELFAISNYDPFSRAFVLSRGIVGSKGDVIKVASPVYKQTFDLRTGECIEDRDVRVPVYESRIESGIVQVKAPALASPENGATKASPGPLSTWTIAIGETRERERLCDMLRAKGATVVACPVVAAADAPDSAAVEQWLKELSAGELDLCVFYTGEGIRRLFATARRMNIDSDVHRALAAVETIARGPKSARALRDVGLLPSLSLETPTTEGIIDLLRSRKLTGTRVGVQLYPRASSKRLLQFLRGAGAEPRPVSPYVYADGSQEPVVKDLVARMVSGHVDVMVFTSRAQVDRLFDVASRLGIVAALSAGLRRTRIATIGPVVAAAVRARNLRVSIVPAELFFMKSLVNEIVAAAQRAAASSS
jgi:uroporphyrinogen-III synthase